MKEKILFSWSSGKDSALALYYLQQEAHYEVIALLSSVTQEVNRISMHGVHKDLLIQQVNALDIPLDIFYLSLDSSNEEYETRMKDCLVKYKEQEVNRVAFGDIFLSDVREYRENNLARLSMKALFPLWGKNTGELAQTFIKLGFKSIVTCVDTKQLDASFSGRFYDTDFLHSLPDHVDPCGENGEFHTFVFDGPSFTLPVPIIAKEKVLKMDRFLYTNIELC